MARAMSALAYCIASSPDVTSRLEDMVLAMRISSLVRLRDIMVEIRIRNMPMTAKRTRALSFFQKYLPLMSSSQSYPEKC